jgi:hypothetical protein
VSQREKPTAVFDDGPGQKSSRGDWTPLELFLAAVRGWEAGFQQNVVIELVGYRP